MGLFDFKPGIYVVENKDGLNIRSLPDSQNPHTLIGRKLTMGKRFPVYSVVTNERGEQWGVISPPTVHANQTLVVCLWDLNTLFAFPVEIPAVSDDVSGRLDRIENYLIRCAAVGHVLEFT